MRTSATARNGMGAVLIVISVLLAAMSWAIPTSADPRAGGTLTAVTGADPTTLDPHLALSVADMAFREAVYENLTQLQHDLTLRPALAESWEPNEDLTSWIFHLRKGVKFHHGKTLTAEDVVFSMDRIMDPDTGSAARSSLDYVSDVTVVDDHTVRFDLKYPNTFLPETLSIYQAKIIPSDIDPSRLATEEFGTGPFTLEEYRRGERLVMNKNPEYWMDGQPYPDEVIVFYMAEEEARVEALLSGQIDVAFLVEAPSVARLEADDDVTVSSVSSASYLVLIMDVRKEPFDNPLVRQAMQAATDRQAIVDATMFGRGTIAHDSPIPPDNAHFSKAILAPPYDPERARKLLAEAGYPNGIDVTLFTSTACEGAVEMAVVEKEKAAAAGIRIDINRVPPDSYWTEVWTVEPFVAACWGARLLDESIAAAYKPDSPWNDAHYDNPEIMQLLTVARGQTDQMERAKTFAEIQRILRDDVPRIVVAFRPLFVAMRKDVVGFEAHPQYYPLLHEVWLDR